MTIIEDTRQQADKHILKNKWFEEHNIKVVRSKLPVGDYANILHMNVVVDTKKDIQEIIGNVTSQHERFKAECQLAQEADISLVILIENTDNVRLLKDLDEWQNPRLKSSPKATTGPQLKKILSTMTERYGVKFLFCKPEESAERIINIIK